MSGPVRLAAIDIGTVTTRLLVADVSEESIVEVERSTDITHLGEGLTETGRLSEAAIGRVVACVSSYVERMRALGVVAHRAVATSASRDAENAQQLLDALTGLGVAPQVIGGSREAELAFLGATEEHPGDGLLVVDCGGGSTELILGDAWRDPGVGRGIRIRHARSIDVGSRRMTELYLLSDPPTRREIDDARAWAHDALKGYFAHLEAPAREMLALAGTATTLAAIHLGLERYDAHAVHGCHLSGSDVSAILEHLAALPLEERKRVVGLHPDRAGVIVAGTLILEVVLALAGLPGFTVSEHDVLYGILRDAHRDLKGRIASAGD